MRLTTVFMIAAIMQVSASGFAQRVTFKAKQGTLQELFKAIKAQTGYNVVMSAEKLEAAKPVSADFKNEALEKVLEESLEGQNLTYTIDQKTIVVREKEPSFLENLVARFTDIDVRGRVVDEKGSPLPNASIRIKGKNAVINTNQNGEFETKGVDEDAVLLVSYVGYKALEIPLKGAVLPLEIKLTLATGELEEVNVTYSTGYQTLPKERATGSFVQIDKEKINEQVGPNFLSRLAIIANSVNSMPKGLGPSQILVRGISTISGPRTPLVILDNFPYEGDVNNINPNEIENITILRDAAAASIWGAKAGNGVIVVTTKKGKLNQKTKVEFNSNVTVTEKPDLFYLKRFSSSDLIELETFLFDNRFYNATLNSLPIRYQTPVIDILEQLRKTNIDSAEAKKRIDIFRDVDTRKDFLKYIYQNAVNQQYTLNLRGGNSNLAWILSGGIDKNIDELAADYNRYYGRIDQTYKPTEKIEINTGVYYTYSKSKTGQNSYGSFSGMFPGYARFIDENGKQIPLIRSYRKTYIDTAGNGLLLDWKYYPLDDYKHTYSNTSIHNLNAKLGVRYIILEGLIADVKYQFERQIRNLNTINDLESYTARELINRYSQINYSTKIVANPIPKGGIMDIRDNTLNVHNMRGQLNFDRSIGKSSISAIAGMEIRDINTDGRTSRIYGYNADLLTSVPVIYNVSYPLVHPNLGSGTIPGVNSLSKITNKYVSTYLNGAYIYKEKYTLSLSGRRDASNLFGVESNKKWNPFWSAGASWDISREKFYNAGFMPYLKIRMTYGYSGNVSPNIASVPTIRYTSSSIYTNEQIAQVNNFKNPDLRWERVKMLNLAIDFKSKNDVVSGSVDYYVKKATDLYGNAPVDRTLGLGASQVLKNFAALKGHGIDVSLTSKNLNRKITWVSDVQFSLYKDEVEKINSSTQSAINFVGGNATAIGYPRYSLFTYKSAGLNQVNGDPQGYLNGKISTNYNALVSDSATRSDLKYYGSVMPTMFGSIGNSISWQGISLTARLSYKLGYYFLRKSNDYSKLFDDRIGHADYARRWRKSGDEKFTTVPSMVYPVNGNREFFYSNSDVLAEKGDHIRLEYVNISYNLSKNRFRHLPFSNLRVFVIANNLGMLWKETSQDIDPDYNDEIPVAKSFSIGVNINL